MPFCGNNAIKAKHLNIIPCPQGCKTKVYLEHLIPHIQTDCPYRCVFCFYCKMPLLYINVQKHLQDCEQIPKIAIRDREEITYNIKPCSSRTAADCNQCKDFKQQIAETILLRQQSSAHQLDQLLQLNLQQKFVLEQQIVELKESVNNWQTKSAVLENELSSLHTKLTQKHPNITESKTSVEENYKENAVTEVLLEKVKKLSTLLKTIEQDVVTTKENIFARQNEQAIDLKKFTEFVLDLMETSNTSTALSLQKHQMEMQKHSENMQQLDLRNTHTGVFIWKVKKFSRLQNEAKLANNHKITSMPFYTNEYGYKLCMELSPKGGASGDYLSISLCILRGGYDAILKWPVSYKATFSLLDQLEGKKPFEATLYSVPEPQYVGRPATDRNASLSFFHFFRIAELEPNYLVNDKIFVKAVVNFVDCDVGSTLDHNKNV